MSERRYTDAEVSAIFEKAAESQQGQRRQLASPDGMTLAELQAIGKEVGIPPELVTQAARSLDSAGRSHTRRLLGLPIGVGRTIELPRRLTEDEWERLVVDLRETFDARGHVRTEGSLRQWTNGNLQALLEPTATGQRLRLRTVKGDARGYIAGGIGMAVAGAFMLGMRLAFGTSPDPGQFMALSTLSALGAGLVALGALRLPSWARLRRKQMEDIATRLAQTTEAPPPSSGHHLPISGGSSG